MACAVVHVVLLLVANTCTTVVYVVYECMMLVEIIAGALQVPQISGKFVSLWLQLKQQAANLYQNQPEHMKIAQHLEHLHACLACLMISLSGTVL
jgi:hypothetical protein